jgi:hypothetical protein
MSANGTATKPVLTAGPSPVSEQEPNGFAVMRGIEARALIRLVTEALTATARMAHELHEDIYAPGFDVPRPVTHGKLTEALSGVQTVDHYLRMLGSVMEESMDGPCPDLYPDQRA